MPAQVLVAGYFAVDKMGVCGICSCQFAMERDFLLFPLFLLYLRAFATLRYNPAHGQNTPLPQKSCFMIIYDVIFGGFTVENNTDDRVAVCNYMFIEID